MITEILTGLLVAVTAFYAWATYKMMAANENAVKAMQNQADSLTRPYITVVPAVDHHGLFYLRISNTGRTAADKVRLTIDHDFFQFADKRFNLREATAFQEPIEQMPPGSELVFDLGQGWVILGKDADPDLTPSVFAIDARYQYADQDVKERTIVDLRPYSQGTTERSAVAEELKKIRQELEKMNKKS